MNIIAIVAIVAMVTVSLFRRVVVRDGFNALRYYNGRLTDVLTPGRYFDTRWNTSIALVDMRLRNVLVSGQELSTADGAAFKLSAVVAYQVAEADRALNSVVDFTAMLYTQAQLALRAATADLKCEDLLTSRASANQKATELTRAAARSFGVNVLGVEIRDVMLAGDLKRAFADVVRARQEGQAALERARAESAVMRNLANTARLLEANPSLMNLRTVQAAERAAGSTWVVSMTQMPAPPLTPIGPPKMGKADEEIDT